MTNGLALGELDGVFRRATSRLTSSIAQVVTDPSSTQGQHYIARIVELERKKLEHDLVQLIVHHVDSATQAAATAAHEVVGPALTEVFGAPAVQSLFFNIGKATAAAVLIKPQHDDSVTMSARARSATMFWADQVKKMTASAAKTTDKQATLAQKRQAYLSDLRLYLAPRTADEAKQRITKDSQAVANPHHPTYRLAENELQHAYTEATISAASAVPTYRGISWRLSPSHTGIDACDDLARVGLFGAGQEPDRPHPYCRCIVTPQHDTSQQFAARLRRWQQAPNSEPGIEDWYQQNSAYLGTPRLRVA